jgi:putative copper resistance protein D
VNPLAQRAVVAWPPLVAEALIFGTTAFCLLIAPTTGSRDRVADAFAFSWRSLALLASVFSPLTLLVTTADMADVSVRGAIPLLPQVVRETHFGHTWSWSFPATLALLVVAWLPISAIIRSSLLCVLAALLLLSGSLLSHAIDRGMLAVSIHFIHQVAAALWLGAIVGVWFGAVRGGFGADWVRRAAPRVSRAAGWSVAVLLLSGLYTAYSALGPNPGRLLDTTYGRTLLVKIGVAMPVLLLGAGNRYWLMATMARESSQKALLRNVSIESALLILILGLAALLANTPPAHH